MINPLAMVRNWFAPRGQSLNAAAQQVLRARLDAAGQSEDMEKWWSGADPSGPNWTARYDQRKKIRERARYEVANNSYAFGIVQTVAMHTIGRGPRLQLTGLVREWNSQIEQAWHEHVEAINLARRLTSMVAARVYDGESFACFFFNPALRTPSTIDMRVIEADQVHDPKLHLTDPRNVDGVILDEWGNPIEYRLLKTHPGEHATLANWEYDTWAAHLVSHLYREDRPGQQRGLSELTPALLLFAILRRFTRATLAAAEAAALFAAFLKTSAASVQPVPNDSVWSSAEIDFGTLTSLPEGWDISQLKPEHPSTTYPQFVNQLLQEIARCLSMPPNIARCNSENYNYSSSRLDHNLYFRRMTVDQQQIAHTILDKLLRIWFLDSVKNNPRLIGIPADYITGHQWFWEPAESIDPAKESGSRDTDLRNGMTTIPIEYAKLGLDYETAQQQAAEALGLTLDEYRRRQADAMFPPTAAPAAGPAASANAPADSVTASVAGEYAGMSRLQLQRNRKAIDDLLGEMLDGTRSQSFTLTMLQVLGLSEETARQMINATLEGQNPESSSITDSQLAACMKRQNHRLRPGLTKITESRPAEMFALAASAGQKLTAAPSGTATISEGGDAGKPKRVQIHAYSGGELLVDGFDLPVVVDLAGVVLHTDNIPYLCDHKEDSEHTIGQSAEVTVGPGGIDSVGPILGENEATQNVVTLAAKGFRWPVSIGGMVQRPERVAAGATVNVNGRDFVGPIIIARGFTLREISFVPVGADPSASASLAASAAKKNGVSKMGFEQWCAEQGFDVATLSDAQKAALMLAYQAATAPVDAAAATAQQQAAPAAAAAAPGCATDPNKPAQAGAAGTTAMQLSTQNLMTASARQGWAAEEARVLQIRRLTASADTGDEAMAKLRIEAIKSGASASDVELSVLRAQANRAPAAIVRNVDNSARVLTAALYRNAGIQYSEKDFTPQELDTAHRQYPSGVGLQELLLMAAASRGENYHTVNSGNLRQVLRAAFSTGSIPGILSNAANKSLLDGYSSVEDAWKQIAYVRSVQDFKSSTAYRLTTDGNFEKIGATGKLKHASFGEESYSVQADTYGRLIAINRQMIINDDLGALSDLPREIGRKAALKLNAVFWAAFLDNSTFFTSGNSNYVTGSTYVLGAVGLEQAIVTFRKQTDPSGAPLGVNPALLLVPPELEATANQLFLSDTFNTGGSSSTSKVPNANVFKGKYKPVPSAYLSNSTYTGYSTTGYYLLADPRDMATIQVAFLNGQQNPTVETADADFDQLGIQMRGYFDFGVALMQYRGGVKVTGA